MRKKNVTNIGRISCQVKTGVNPDCIGLHWSQKAVLLTERPACSGQAVTSDLLSCPLITWEGSTVSGTTELYEVAIHRETVMEIQVT